MTFELPGIAPTPWHAFKNPRGFGWSVADAKGTGICSQVAEDFAKLIASIPDMVEEIGRRQLIHESDQACIRASLAEVDRLRSLNAEMREQLHRMLGRFEKCAIAMRNDVETVKIATFEARAILAKSQETAP
jgi:hypothetical protein